MPPPEIDVPEIDPTTLDLTKRVADLDAIRRVNPHRHEMELLTAVTELDPARHFIVGFKDATDQDFWVRGHMPGFPLLPGVLMCEAAAQLCAYYVVSQGVVKGNLMGLGGIEMAKFKRMVRPGDRLVLVGHGLKVDRRLTRFHVRGYVGADLAYETVVVGVPLKTGG
jgi:3-hydroxyacyl-[acyl-carrier-protein] dehydratase